jgi:hypothetical protein
MATLPPRRTPPRRTPPGSLPPRSPGGRTPGRVRPPQPRREIARPPLAPVASAVALLLVMFIVSLRFSRTAVGPHILIAALAMFGSVTLLWWFQRDLSLRRSSRAFSDWSSSLTSERLMRVVVGLSWSLGAWNLFISIFEFLKDWR